MLCLWVSSFCYKMGSECSERPIHAAPFLSSVSPRLPSKMLIQMQNSIAWLVLCEDFIIVVVVVLSKQELKDQRTITSCRTKFAFL